MSRHRKRGRPKMERPEKDAGTPELQRKRSRGETQEWLDWCLQRALVTRAQHWCGMHLRWLYTLRYGVPTPQAAHALKEKGLPCLPPVLTERSKEEKEYVLAVQALRERGLLEAVLGICVFGASPQPLRHEKEITAVVTGLDVLTAHWREHLQRLQITG